MNHEQHQHLHSRDIANALKSQLKVENAHSNSTQDVNLAYNGGAWNHGTTLAIDCIGYRSIRIWGDISNSQLSIKATNATNTGNAGFWDSFGTDVYSGKFSLYYPDPPRNIKFENESGETITAVNLQYSRIK
tara:strand:+ start:361 stop:756 length:396 start_codon:yes stop_codon:yes gene_type:complete